MNVPDAAPRSARPKTPSRSNSRPPARGPSGSSQPSRLQSPARPQAPPSRPDQGPSAARVEQSREEGQPGRSEHLVALRDNYDMEACELDSRMRVATGSTPRDCEADSREHNQAQEEAARRPRPVAPPGPELTEAERKAILERESRRNAERTARVWTPVEPEAAGRTAFEECRIAAELQGQPYDHCGGAAAAAEERVRQPLPPGEST